MLKHNRFFAALLLAVLFMAGCGGTGDNDASNPEGAFVLGMNPDSDGIGGGSIALEIEVEKGEISFGFCRYTDTHFFPYTTYDVEGTASTGSIEATADFGDYVVEIVAVYSGIGWHGSYKLYLENKLVEEGALTITKSSATRNVIGFWEGTLQFSKGDIEVDMEMDQKGNQVIMQGTIDGSPVSGVGSIVGKSLSLEISFVDSDFMTILGNVNGDQDRISGQGYYGEVFDFDLQKVEVK